MRIHHIRFALTDDTSHNKAETSPGQFEFALTEIPPTITPKPPQGVHGEHQPPLQHMLLPTIVHWHLQATKERSVWPYHQALGYKQFDSVTPP